MRVVLVSTCMALTVAPATVAPDASVTDPAMVAVVACPKATAQSKLIAMK